jgi:hypothetical protein
VELSATHFLSQGLICSLTPKEGDRWKTPLISFFVLAVFTINTDAAGARTESGMPKPRRAVLSASRRAFLLLGLVLLQGSSSAAAETRI